MEKMPPMEKIYEAYSAIADGRVEMLDGRATVTSSDGAKAYAVQWEGDHYRSSDSATYWQGYAGYPVIAVLMRQGRLPLDRAVAAHFAGVNWTALNKKHKRDYAAAAAEVTDGLKARGVDTEEISKTAEAAYGALKTLDITVGRSAKPRT